MSTQEPSKCCVCGQPTTKHCQACARGGFDLFFCSPEHQKLAWKNHRRLCGPDAAKVMPVGTNLRGSQTWQQILWEVCDGTGRQAELFNSTRQTLNALSETQYADITEATCAMIYSGSAVDLLAAEDMQDVQELQEVQSMPACFASALLFDIKKYVPGSQDFVSLQPLRNVVYHHAFVLHALIGHKNAKERPPAYEDSLIPAALSQLLNGTLRFISIRHSDISDFLATLRKNVLRICSIRLKFECVHNEETDEVTKFICTL